MLDRSFGLLAGRSAVYLSAAVTIQSTIMEMTDQSSFYKRENVAPGETRRHSTGIGCTQRLGPNGLDRPKKQGQPVPQPDVTEARAKAQNATVTSRRAAKWTA